MATPGAEFATRRRKVADDSGLPGASEADLRELESEISSHREYPQSVLLKNVIERLSAITLADGAAIAVCDQWGVVCRASVGEAPEVGSRLRPDSALTREAFETAQVVVCEDTETDYRVRRSTAKSLRLRSAVVVPITAEKNVLGVIEVLSARPRAFNAAHVAGLLRIGELLAETLVPAPPPLPPAPPPGATVVDYAPSQIFASAENVVAPIPIVVPAQEPKPKSNAGLQIACAIILLLLLYFAVIRSRHGTISSPTVAPRSVPGASTAPAPQPLSVPETSPPASTPRSEPGPSPQSPTLAPSVLSPSGTPSPKTSGVASANSSSTRNSVVPKNLAAEKTVALPTRPASPALVVRGVPPRTKIFIDDQVVAWSDASGEATIPTMAQGAHHLRLSADGYRDFDQTVEVPPGKTAAITARLETQPPILTPRPNLPPPVAAAPAIPPPVTATPPTPPAFALDRSVKAHSGWVTSVAFSPDGRRLVSGSWDRTVKSWDISTGEQLTLGGKKKEIQALAFSRDGRFLAAENSSDNTALLDSTTGQEIRALATDKPLGTLGSDWVYSIAFSPDDRWLASGIDDKTVRIWDVKTGQKVRDLIGLHRPVIYIAFSPDGRLLATGDDEKSIRIWDPSNGEQIYKLSGHKKVIYAVAFSSNNRWLASASADKTVKLWDLKSGREAHTLAGHGNVVTSLAFSSDGRWLVSGSWDKTIKIWDVETGKEIQTLAGHDHPIYSVAFDSRGRWLASGSEDGTIKLWRLSDSPKQSEWQRR